MSAPTTIGLTTPQGSRSIAALDAHTQTKYLLDESEIPTHWYNIVPDLPHPPAPVLHPGTGQPIGPADLAPLFPMALIAQEVSQDKTIEIPDEVRDVYRLSRPTPLFRARRLERALDTTAHIYSKYEGVISPGSLGIAISEAVEDAATHDDAHYSLGSVLNHVLLHQTVIGQEALKQMDRAGEYPDVVIGCVGGGSNFAGLAFPFVGEKLRQG